MLIDVLFTILTSSLNITHELGLIEIVQRYMAAVANAFAALHTVPTPPLWAITTRSVVVASREMTRLSAACPRPKSMILSQNCAVPKLASKSIVIPLLN